MRNALHRTAIDYVSKSELLAQYIMLLSSGRCQGDTPSFSRLFIVGTKKWYSLVLSTVLRLTIICTVRSIALRIYRVIGKILHGVSLKHNRTNSGFTISFYLICIVSTRCGKSILVCSLIFSCCLEASRLNFDFI